MYSIQLPLPPEALASLEAEDFELVSDQDCLVPSGGNLEVFAKLEEDLKSQLKVSMCKLHILSQRTKLVCLPFRLYRCV